VELKIHSEFATTTTTTTTTTPLELYELAGKN
jgi:hypothetical protein